MTACRACVGWKTTLLAWHGCSDASVLSTCTNGPQRLESEDGGWFGGGVYLTPQAEYAGFYACGQREPVVGEEYAVVLCWVTMSNVYPVTRTTDYGEDRDGETRCKFDYKFGGTRTDKALKAGFDGHWVAVAQDDGFGAAREVRGAEVVDEVVVAEAAQVVPRYVVRFTFRRG